MLKVDVEIVPIRMDFKAPTNQYYAHKNQLHENSSLFNFPSHQEIAMETSYFFTANICALFELNFVGNFLCCWMLSSSSLNDFIQFGNKALQYWFESCRTSHNNQVTLLLSMLPMEVSIVIIMIFCKFSYTFRLSSSLSSLSTTCTLHETFLLASLPWFQT